MSAPNRGGLVDEYGQVVGSGAPPQRQPAYDQPPANGQPAPQYRDPQPSQPDYGGYSDPESADGGSWNDGGDYQAPPPGARIYRDGDPSYGVERGGPVPPAGVGEDGQAGVYQARPAPPQSARSPVRRLIHGSSPTIVPRRPWRRWTLPVRRG